MKGTHWGGKRKGENNPNWKGGLKNNVEYRRSYLREWYSKNKDKPEFKEKQRVYREKYRPRKLLRSKDWKEGNANKMLWSNAKYRAKKEGLEFNLDFEDIIIPKFCQYLNLELTAKKGIGRADSQMSLDRIDPDKGYVKGNVSVISYKANRMKNDASINELLIFAKNIIKLYGETD
jgi:hypothetical protein